ncbi:MAG: rhodanese-like domain-containing protein [Elusimicrobiales bacterium]|nr:rhodanese-like domain-containing protein [Elusimicrobiales bacterium]
MKIILVATLLIFAAAGAYAFDLAGLFSGCCGAASLKDLAAPAPAAPEALPKPGNCDFPVNIKPEEARYFIEAKKPVVIDIRTAEEHAAGYIAPTHMVLDYYAPDFKAQLEKLDKNAKYLLYCRSGRRTGAALLIMKDLGFTDIHDIAGGITAWQAAGLPVVK